MNEFLAPEEADLLAAEFALGLLDGEELRLAERRAAEDPQFAASLATWQERTAGWLDDLSSDPAGPDLWARIESSLDQPKAGRTSMRPSRSVRYWRNVAFASMAASLALAVALTVALVRPAPVSQHVEREPATPNIAQISAEDGSPLVSAVYYAESGTMLLRTADLQSPDKAPELWVIDDKGKPHSLGLIGDDGILTVVLSPEVRRLLSDQAVLAITLENREGAPHEAPTGDILGTAKLTTL